MFSVGVLLLGIVSGCSCEKFYNYYEMEVNRDKIVRSLNNLSDMKLSENFIALLTKMLQ